MKQKKTAKELTALIMQEVRQHPDWNDIMDVAITRPVQSAADSGPSRTAIPTHCGQRSGDCGQFLMSV
jgi:hypothetical protein